MCTETVQPDSMCVRSLHAVFVIEITLHAAAGTARDHGDRQFLHFCTLTQAVCTWLCALQVAKAKFVVGDPSYFPTRVRVVGKVVRAVAILVRVCVEVQWGCGSS